MRMRIEVVTRARELPWDVVLAPGRGLAYHWLADADPELATVLHERGWGPHGMAPFGYGAPRFPAAAQWPGHYASGGAGHVEFGSPLPEVMAAWSCALQDRDTLNWGGVTLRVTRVALVDPPRFSSGTVSLRTVTPVVLRALREGQGPGLKTSWVLPREAGYTRGRRRGATGRPPTDPAGHLVMGPWPVQLGGVRLDPLGECGSRPRAGTLSRMDCGA